VVDTANMLSPEARQRLEEKLATLERETGDQVAVLTIPSLQGEPLEDYSLKVAQTWGLGKKGKDTGVLLLIAQQDRKMRLEVGYGLEEKLTDLQTHVIQDEVIRPRFQAGDFAGGIEAGVDAVAAALRGQPVQTPERPEGVGDLPAGSKVGFSLLFLILAGTFSLLAIFSSGCQSWFLYALLIPVYWVVPSSFLGPQAGLGFALGWLIGFPLLKLLIGGRGGPGGGPGGRRRRSGGWAWPIFFPVGGGGWSSRGGGWGRGGGFGGGFGGGGFSGGGGSFGGGGSSGSW
jgi:uncharacterized protein